jgi:hypothetical protein
MPNVRPVKITTPLYPWILMLCDGVLPPWSQPARPGGAFGHCLCGALSVDAPRTLIVTLTLTQPRPTAHRRLLIAQLCEGT